MKGNRYLGSTISLSEVYKTMRYLYVKIIISCRWVTYQQLVGGWFAAMEGKQELALMEKFLQVYAILV